MSETFVGYFRSVLQKASQRGLTQQEIATRAGVTAPWITRVKNGDIKTPDPASIIAVAEAGLGKGTDYFHEKRELSRLYQQEFGMALDFFRGHVVLKAMTPEQQAVFILLFLNQREMTKSELDSLLGQDCEEALSSLLRQKTLNQFEGEQQEQYSAAFDRSAEASLRHDIALTLLTEIRSVRDNALLILRQIPLIQTNAPEPLIEIRKNLLREVSDIASDEKNYGLDQYQRDLSSNLGLLKGDTSFAAGNLINLLAIAKKNVLSDLKLGGLDIHHADFRGVCLHRVSLQGAYINNCRFSDTFGSVWDVGFLEDETYFAASTVTSTVNIWHSLTGRLERELGPKETSIHGWSFAFDSRANSDSPHIRVASAGGSGEVRVWHNAMDSGSQAVCFQAHKTRVRSVRFLAEERLLTCGEDGAVHVWQNTFGRYNQKQIINEGPRQSSLAMAANEAFFLTGNFNGQIAICDFVDENFAHEQDQIHVHYVDAHRSNIVDLAISADATTALSVSDDLTARIWNVLRKEGGVSLELASELPGTDPSNTLNTAPEASSGCFIGGSSSEIAIGRGDGSLSIFRSRPGGSFVETRKLRSAHTSIVRAVSSARSGSHLITGGDDATVHLWNIERDAEGHVSNLVRLQSHSGVIASPRAAAHFRKSGTLVTAHDDGRLRFWDAKTLEQLDHMAIHEAHPGRIWDVKFLESPRQGRLLVSAGEEGMIKMWKGGSNSTPSFTSNTKHNYRVFGIAIIPAPGPFVASGGQDRTLRIWSDEAQQLHCERNAHAGRIRDVEYLSRHQLLVSCGEDGTAKFWRVQAHGQLTLDHTFSPNKAPKLTQIIASPEGDTVYFTADDGGVHGYRPKTQSHFSSDKIARRPLLCGALISGGKILVCGGEEGRLHLLDADQLTPVGQELEPCHKDWIEDISASPDDQSFVTVSDDQYLKRFQLLSNGNGLTNPIEAQAALDYNRLDISGLKGPDVDDVLISKLKALGAFQTEGNSRS